MRTDGWTSVSRKKWKSVAMMGAMLVGAFAGINGFFDAPADADTYSPTFALPSPASLAVVVGDGGSNAYVLGGEGAANLVQTVNLDSEETSFHSISISLVASCGVYLNGGIYTFGGMDGTYTPISTIYRYDVATQTISAVGSMPLPVYWSCAVTDGQRIYVFGGYEHQNWTMTDRIWEFNPATNLLKRPAGNPVLPTSLYHAAAVWTGSSAYVLGGYGNFGQNTYIFKYDPSTSSCGYVCRVGRYHNNYEMTIPHDTEGACAAYLDGTVYLYGGYSTWAGSRTNMIQTYTPSSGMAVASFDTLPISLMDAGCVAHGDRVYILGGDTGSGPTRSIGVHKPVAFGKAETLSTGSNLLSYQLRGSSAVRDGTGPAYILGGYSGSFPVDYIMRYDPATAQTWGSPQTLNEAVSDAAAAMWHGKAFIFGGNSSGSSVNYIQVYDDINDQCLYASTFMSFGMTGMKAFTYNDQIFVLGGADLFGNYYSEVYLFDPSSQTWNPVAVANLPQQMAYYGMAWTGEKAYLVGGKGYSGYYDTIIEFDPSTLMSQVVAYLPEGAWRCMAAHGNDGYVHIFGGLTAGAPYNLATHYLFKPETGELQASSVPLPLPLHDAAIIDGDISIFGGVSLDGMPVGQVLSYRNEPRGKDGWSEITENDYSDGFMAGAAAYFPSDGATYVFGGLNKNGEELATILKIEGGTGKLTTVGTMPWTRSRATAVALGEYIYIFGGDSFTLGEYCEYVDRFHPATGAYYSGYDALVAREGMGGCTDGTNIYLIGGNYGATVSTSIEVWTPTGYWQYTDSFPIGVSSPVVGYRSGRVYIAGGSDSSGLPTSRVYVYDTVNRTVGTAYTLPLKVRGAFGGMTGRDLAICGGSQTASLASIKKHTDRVMLFDTVTKATRYADFRLASACEDASGTAEGGFYLGGFSPYSTVQKGVDVTRICLEREDRQFSALTTNSNVLFNTITYHAAAYNGINIYTIGGYQGATGTVPNSNVIKYNPSDWSYTTGTTGYSSASDIAATYDETTGRIYFSGGFYSSTSSYWANSRYINPSGTISSLLNMNSPRAGHGLMARDGNIYAVGGQTTGGTYVATVERLTAGGTSWTSQGTMMLSTTTTLPLAHFAYASDGSCLYMFGGHTGTSTKTDRIYRFDPYTNNVTCMKAKLPSARGYSCAAYDAEQNLFMIFGGIDTLGAYLDDALIYDPTLDALWEAGFSLPIPLAGACAVFDDAMVIGGTSSSALADRSNDVFSFDYIRDSPLAEDEDSGPTSAPIVVQSEFPQISNHDIVESSTMQSVLNWQIQPGYEHSFKADVGLSTGFSNIDYVDVYAWYDCGDDTVGQDYNTTFGRNRNMHFRYDYNGATMTGVFQRFYPPSPDVTGFWGKATTLSANEKRLEFYFTPSVFTAWADGVSGGSTPATGGDATVRDFGFNDPYSWNFKIMARDVTASSTTVYDEFGVYKHQEMLVSGGDPSVTVTPGGGTVMMDTSNPGDFVYMNTRINCPFRLNVNVTNLVGASGQIDAAWNLAVSGGDLGATVTFFTQAYYPGRIYVRGTDNGAYYLLTEVPAGGYHQTAVNWYVSVPIGTAEGMYTGFITYRMETAEDSSAGSFNHAPYASAAVTPGDGTSGVGHPTTLMVTVYDQDFDAITVKFYNAATHALLGQSTVADGMTASCTWGTSAMTTYEWYVVLSDGQDETQTPTYSFTTGA